MRDFDALTPEPTLPDFGNTQPSQSPRYLGFVEGLPVNESDGFFQAHLFHVFDIVAVGEPADQFAGCVKHQGVIDPVALRLRRLACRQLEPGRRNACRLFGQSGIDVRAAALLTVVCAGFEVLDTISSRLRFTFRFAACHRRRFGVFFRIFHFDQDTAPKRIL